MGGGTYLRRSEICLCPPMLTTHMCSSVQKPNAGCKDGFVIIPFKSAHLYKIASLLCEWQYVVISDFVVDEKVKIPGDPYLAGKCVKWEVKKFLGIELVKGIRSAGDEIYLHNNSCDSENEFGIWLMAPEQKNYQKQDIIIGPYKHKDNSFIHFEDIREMFKNGPKQSMMVCYLTL